MSTRVQLVDGSITPSLPRRFDGCGAVVTFQGCVRGSEQDQPIAALLYEVYEPMTRRMLAQLANDVAARFALTHIEAIHSYGRVNVGECSFVLHIGAPRRKAALAAMDFFIDEMKRVVPIWKVAVTDSGALLA